MSQPTSAGLAALHAPLMLWYRPKFPFLGPGLDSQVAHYPSQIYLNNALNHNKIKTHLNQEEIIHSCFVFKVNVTILKG